MAVPPFALCAAVRLKAVYIPYLVCGISAILAIENCAIERNATKEKRIRQHSPTAFCQLFNGYTQRPTHSHSECLNTHAPHSFPLSFRSIRIGARACVCVCCFALHFSALPHFCIQSYFNILVCNQSTPQTSPPPSLPILVALNEFRLSSQPLSHHSYGSPTRHISIAIFTFDFDNP